MITHPETTRLLEHLHANPPQALLLTGTPGVGLHDAAMAVVGSRQHTFVLPVEKPSSRIISVDTIRQLYGQTKSKLTTHSFVVIDEADLMTHTAQAAFLKLLEEPGGNIHFVLTSSRPEQFLPTILSRVQQHAVRPISLEQSIDLLVSLGITDATKQQQLLFIAEGKPEKLRSLVNDDAQFETLVTHMQDARELLQASTYKRLLIAHKYRADRGRAVALIEAAIKITKHSLAQAPKPGQVTQLARLLETQRQLEGNHNIRLCLARFVV